jgi:hypothetical protein
MAMTNATSTTEESISEGIVELRTVIGMMGFRTYQTGGDLHWLIMGTVVFFETYHKK